MCDYVHEIIKEWRERKEIHGPSLFVLCDQLRVQHNEATSYGKTKIDKSHQKIGISYSIIVRQTWQVIHLYAQSTCRSKMQQYLKKGKKLRSCRQNEDYLYHRKPVRFYFETCNFFHYTFQ